MQQQQRGGGGAGNANNGNNRKRGSVVMMRAVNSCRRYVVMFILESSRVPAQYPQHFLLLKPIYDTASSKQGVKETH